MTPEQILQDWLAANGLEDAFYDAIRLDFNVGGSSRELVWILTNSIIWSFTKRYTGIDWGLHSNNFQKFIARNHPECANLVVDKFKISKSVNPYIKAMEKFQ